MSEGLQTLLHYAECQSERPRVAGLVLTLHISDPELCAELEEHEEGRPRHDFAVSALKIGTMALRTPGDASMPSGLGRKETGCLRTSPRP